MGLETFALIVVSIWTITSTGLYIIAESQRERVQLALDVKIATCTCNQPSGNKI